MGIYHALMPRLERLGHVGIHVSDIDTMKDFYTRVVGLQVAEDQAAERGMVFLTSNPDHEHHELLLMAGRNVPTDARVLQQISFRVPSFEDVQAYAERFKREGVQVEDIVTHGFAVGVYFFDPEGNRLEVYWDTNVRGHKAFRRSIDVERPKDDVMAEAERILDEIPSLSH
jgi:catechol-2,3-dioxygenase